MLSFQQAEEMPSTELGATTSTNEDGYLHDHPIVTILVVNLIMVSCTCHQFYKGICKIIFVSYLLMLT